MADKRFIKGLFKDTAHIDQPEGSWRYALNAFLNHNDGAVSNEGGNEVAGKLDVPTASGGIEFYLVVGEIAIDNDRTVLFLKDQRPKTAAFTPFSAIGIFDPKGTATAGYINRFKLILELDVNNPTSAFISKNLDLNFSLNHRIEGTFKIDSRNNTIIYWTDDLNPPRSLNVTRQETSTEFMIYNTPISTSTNAYYIEQLNLFPHSGQVPHITLVDNGDHQDSVKEGGGLLTGVYYLALAYVSEDFVATNFVTVSNPVSIVDEFDHTRPTYKKDGAKDGVQTSKSIRWRVENLNSDYPYIRPVVIRKMGDAIDAYRLNDLDNAIVSDTTKGITFSGVEGYAKASIDEVIIDTVSYEKAKTINQLDGILYLGNLASRQDLGFQKYANNIKVNSVLKEIDPFDEIYYTVDGLESGYQNSQVDSGNIVDDTKSYRYQPNIYKYKGYKRDEVYALYLAFIMNDGSMSYAYHIPGRENNNIEWHDDAGYISQNGIGNGPYDEYASAPPGDFRELSPSGAKLFHFWDSSSVNQGANRNPFGNCRHMNYWHNATEFYPDTENYEVWDNTGGGTQIGSLRGRHVRHNHFPSNENLLRKSIDSCHDIEEYENTEEFQTQDGANWNGVFGVRQNNTQGSAAPKFIVGGFSTTGVGWSGSTMWRDSGGSGGGMGAVDPSRYTSSAYASDMRNALYTSGINGGGRLTAVQDNTEVWVTYSLRVEDCCGAAGSDYDMKIVHNSSVTGPNVCGHNHNTYLDENDTWVSAGTSCHNANSNGIQNPDVPGYFGWHRIILNQGEYVEVRAKNRNSDQDIRQTDDSCNTSGFIVFDVRPNYSTGGPLNNVKISHKVRALGFQLEDIKIPRAIADKVQGFRVYYAKREHSDKTILGQSVITPQLRAFGKIGICQEAVGNTLAVTTLQALSNTEETFYVNSAYARDASEYKNYKQISFYDFNLLRTKNSIAPATHIKVQYGVYDYAWNGPDVETERLELTELEEDTDGVLSTNTIYSNDSTQNCITPQVRSGLFVGRNYVDTKAWFSNAAGSIQTNVNRVLGQKAKSYVIGDSIFDGRPLGLSKIMNLYGETHIALAFKDGHELPTISTVQDGNYGEPEENQPSTLLNLNGTSGFSASDYCAYIADNGDVHTNGSQIADLSNMHESYIVDLKAFKSDVYKSIDSQDLIWTGFEVLNEELENFIFEEDGYMSGTGNTATLANFNQDQINQGFDGIFGGDTFLCRHGVTKHTTPSYSNADANSEKAVYEHIVESVDNINFRHTESDESLYFPGTHFKALIQKMGKIDLHSQDNLKYNKNYSENNDLRTAIPLPVKDPNQTEFPTRTHRSAKNDTTSLIDNYRLFLANQFKDLPRNRGELWKLSSFSNLLYFHMEDSLFKAKGKQSLQMKDGSESFVGSGDIFQQDPDEVVQTSQGYGGTQSQYAAITTKAGYFFVDKKSRKVFLMRDQLVEISANGMENWFRENMAFTLERYGATSSLDNPLAGVGFHSVWDSKYKRIILTKRDIVPSQEFIDNWIDNVEVNTLYDNAGTINYDSNLGQYYVHGGYGMAGVLPHTYIDFNDTEYFRKSGWTISYFPELNIWVSFHSYVPYIYLKSSTTFYSITDKYDEYLNGDTAVTGVPDAISFAGNAGIWEHHAGKKGVYYEDVAINQTPNNFELEFIHNSSKTLDKIYSSFDFTLQTFKYNTDTLYYDLNVLEHGFDKFIMYNTHQMDERDLIYFVNTRRVGNEWKVNKFRDRAALSTNVDAYYTNAATNIIGGVNDGTLTTLHTESKFEASYLLGYYTENLNANYLNLGKAWNLQKKFVDKWLGIRLICRNEGNKLLNLYATNVASRKFYR